MLSWLDSLGFAAAELAALRGDVSARRYFRVLGASGGPAVLAFYPSAERAVSERFLASTELFESAGIRVPRILASDPTKGFMLLEDLGSTTVFDLTDRAWPDVKPHVETAIEFVETLAGRPKAEFASLNPKLDARRLEAELHDAQDVFLSAPEFSGTHSEREALYSVLEELLGALASEPLVPSHRDFMSRNLMLPPDTSGLAVIDHQDACLAPRYYDLASLLNDSLFLSRSQESELLSRISDDPPALASYRRCAVQRTLKATATYIKFALRGSDRHLALVARTLARAAAQIERLPEGNRVSAAICSRWRNRDSIARGLDRLLRRQC
ncbi:MAG: phosphotransferase [bacterium]|nr:phosphotransferase [bacterium]